MSGDLPADVKALPDERLILHPTLAPLDEPLLDLWVAEGVPRDLSTILHALNVMAGLWLARKRSAELFERMTADFPQRVAEGALEGQQTVFGGGDGA